MQDGQLSVLNYSPAPSTLKQDEEEPDEEEDREMSRINVKHREHCPRWAYIHISAMKNDSEDMQSSVFISVCLIQKIQPTENCFDLYFFSSNVMICKDLLCMNTKKPNSVIMRQYLNINTMLL